MAKTEETKKAEAPKLEAKEKQGLVMPKMAEKKEPSVGKLPEETKKLEMDFSQQYVHKQIRSITFGTLSPEMIKKMASAKIVTPELYDKEGYPVDGGLMDIRLGVIDPGLKCKTCGSKLKECIGHFGYIELARPIVHIKFIAIVLNLLRSTCRDCS